jgi:hypothetical protein
MRGVTRWLSVCCGSGDRLRCGLQGWKAWGAAAGVVLALALATPVISAAQEKAVAAGVSPSAKQGSTMRRWMPYGGVHEFGVTGGLSWVSGPIWGYRTQVHYAPIDVRYSYLLTAREHFTVRYSPEVTAVAWLDEPVIDDSNNVIGRKHTFGSGISPVGFQVDFRPSHRVQPFWANNAGVLYFADHVLSPQGSQFMYTIDFGGGFNIHIEGHRAVTIGYRYQHLSNANISLHNPGTDAGTFYVGFSQFHTHGVR